MSEAVINVNWLKKDVETFFRDNLLSEHQPTVVLSADSLRGFNGRLRPKERVLFVI